ncbi:MAG: hypothetical protein KF861_21920 [Planctomycetaceae bacterium]|nr:hypothetical protein [Planctomycetaceae bacterium]
MVQPKPYIVRQHAGVFAGFVLVGAVFVAAPWFIADWDNILVRAFFTILGCLTIFVGLRAWRTCRIGLAADKHGLWCSGVWGVKHVLIPWDSMQSVRRITWNSIEGAHDGVLLALDEHWPHPLGVEAAHRVRSELQRRIGPQDEPNPLVLGHDEWDWRIDELIDLVRQCIRDPGAREELGEFRPSKGTSTMMINRSQATT